MFFNEVEVVMEDQKISKTQFWKCISILLRNFHAINKKIFASILKQIWEIDVESRKHLTTEQQLKSNLKNAILDEIKCKSMEIEYKYLSKKDADIMANVVIDFDHQSYTCKFIDCSKFDDFQVHLSENDQLEVTMLTQNLDVEQSNRWADYVLKPKLLKWCQSNTNIDETDHVGSLHLVDLEVYNNLYRELKEKHANTVKGMWCTAGESTDPLKFIYEDLAIAAYLICLWRDERQSGGTWSPKAFADLGCGNGLLVYILQQEGYQGYGYDIRARKLWSQYPPNTNLIEQPIDPLKFQLPKDVDWLIGNHSDELSPWLPVMAGLGRFGMRYFLLPCCAYEFAGQKFRRRNTGISVYQDFMTYAHVISQQCGFETLHDRLKIPSTKRKALLGLSRNYSQAEHNQKVREIQGYVQQEMRLNDQEEQQVKIREKQEKVRNCTQIDANIINNLVLKIFKMLLNEEERPQDEAAWHQGKRLQMRDIAQQLSTSDLKNIKAECGGIKTLLRNKHEIFEFCGNNLIGIRKPQRKVALKSDKTQILKRRQCFFQQNHPQGCPLSAEQCTFVH